MKKVYYFINEHLVTDKKFFSKLISLTLNNKNECDFLTLSNHLHNLLKGDIVNVYVDTNKIKVYDYSLTFFQFQIVTIQGEN